MKMYKVIWKMQHFGESTHEATSKKDILRKESAGELINDFGNPDEFDDKYDCDSGWSIYSIEEIKGGEPIE